LYVYCTSVGIDCWSFSTPCHQLVTFCLQGVDVPDWWKNWTAKFPLVSSLHSTQWLFSIIMSYFGVHSQWNEFESRWHTSGYFYFVVPLHFLALQVQLVVLVNTYLMVSTVWPVSCLLFFYSRLYRAQPFGKVGTHAPVPYGVGATDWKRENVHYGKPKCTKCSRRHMFIVKFLVRLEGLA